MDQAHIRGVVLDVAVCTLGGAAAVVMIWAYTEFWLAAGILGGFMDASDSTRDPPVSWLSANSGTLYLYAVTASCLWLLSRTRRPLWKRMLQADALLFVALVVPILLRAYLALAIQ